MWPKNIEIYSICVNECSYGWLYFIGSFISAASRSVIPFISAIPTEVQEEFMDDFVSLAMSYNNESTPQGVIVEMPYQFLVAYAGKKS